MTDKNSKALRSGGNSSRWRRGLYSREGYRLTAGDMAFHLMNYTFFFLFAIVCIFPFYYLFINTISNNELVRTGQVTFWPRDIHFTNYLQLRYVTGLTTAVMVSIARTLLGTATMVLATAFVGYLVTKREMFGRTVIYRIMVTTMYLNAGLIPWFLNMSMLGLTNNFMAYVIPGIVAPYNIILVKTYIESIPAELEESAKIDGAGYWTIFSRIVFPLSKPILATIAIFGAVGHWNSFTDSMILMSGRPDLYTLQYRLYIYLTSTSNLSALMESGGGGINQSGTLQAALNMRTIKLTVAMVSIIPILLVYPFMQRYFTKGIMLGAVKG